MYEIYDKDINETSVRIRKAATRAKSETELQLEIEHILRNFFEKVGIKYEPHHNVTVVRGRPDTLYGRAVIEYKIPGTLRSKSKVESALSEVQNNILEAASSNKEDPSKYVGIILDGERITFTKFRRRKWQSEVPAEIMPETVRRFLEHLRGLARKPLRASLMVEDFGPDSQVAKECVQVLYKHMTRTKSPRVEALYNEWKKTFSQVCGYDLSSVKANVKELVNAYSISVRDVELSELLFTVHTYYALVIKLLAAEITVTYASPIARSFLEEIAAIPSDELVARLQELEEGGVFSQLGIKNFLEGDFFGWYIDIWNKDIETVVAKVIRTLSGYEPATATLEPDEVRDLLKNLYQYLVPRRIRHDLGEFFTPDWLADLVLNETGFDGNPDKRILDPGCGSGTFLVLAIKRMKEFSETQLLAKAETRRKILDNVVGFDLNPLAVIAARTNYLIAMGDLLRSPGEIYIPVYLCDSISTPETGLFGKTIPVQTSVGKFIVPASIVKEDTANEVFTVIDECIKNHYTPKEFTERIEDKLSDSDGTTLRQLKKLYEELLELELKGVNRIWTRVIKNALVPFFEGEFDYVVGNPPWVNWESLPEQYRRQSVELWTRYGLFTLKGYAARLGGGKKDLSMIFTYVSADRYLKDRGVLGFVITQTVFKSRGAGEGFRRFRLGQGKPLGISKVHDLVDLRPFEDASNQTAVVVLTKNEPTSYPVPYVLWGKKGNLTFDMSLEEVKAATTRSSLMAEPVDRQDTTSPWFTLPRSLLVLRSVVGPSQYRARAGSYTGGANGVYWVRILERERDGNLLVENLFDVGKKKVKRVQKVIEPDLVYPLIKSRNIRKWRMIGEHVYALHVQDPEKRIGYDEHWLKRTCPKTYAYLREFEDVLRARSSNVVRQLMEDGPFYSMYAVGKETFSPCKVTWVSMGSKLAACVTGSIQEKAIGEKPIVPEHVLMFIPCEKESEAHYLCAILNSSIANKIVQSYSIKGGKSFASAHILEFLNIKKFDPKNEIHKELSQLSRLAHNLAAKDSPVDDVQRKIDRLVAKIYGLTAKELAATA